jgi:hypothetical protein
MQSVLSVAERPNVPFEALLAYAAKSYRVPVSDIQVLLVEDGYGTHTHDEKCQWGHLDEDAALRNERHPSCYRDLNNSDWIVHLQYNERGHQSVFGVYKGEFVCWMD